MKRFTYFIVFYFLIICNIFSQDQFKNNLEQLDELNIINNPSKPLFKDPKINLKKIWEIGGENPGFILNQICAIDVDEYGYIYVIDQAEKEVKIFSPSGEYLNHFGRKGQGPGEFNIPNCMCLIPNNKILVIDISSLKNKFNFFNKDYEYIESYNAKLGITDKLNLEDRSTLLSLRTIWFCKYYTDSKLLLFTNFTEEMKYNGKSIWIYDLNTKSGNEIIIFKKVDPIFNNQIYQNSSDFLDTQWCNDQNGNIYVISDMYEYEIKVYDMSGHLKRKIRREFKLPKKSNDEYEKDTKTGEQYVSHYKKFGKKIIWKTLKEKPIIFNLYEITRSMFCDDKNQLWVLTNEPYTPSKVNKSSLYQKSIKKDSPIQKATSLSFDIFDSKGSYLTKVPFEAEQPRCFVYKKGFLYFAALKDDGYPWLFKYKIEDVEMK